MLALGIKLVQKCQQDLCYLNNLSKNKILILIIDILGGFILNFETILDYFLRFALSMICGILLGIERKSRQNAVGIRTLVLISISCCLLSILSVHLAQMGVIKGDPTRIASTAVTGIGFIGGGAILKQGLNIRGLTTAAIILTSAAIGLSCGAGLYVPVVITMVIVLVILFTMNRLEKVIFPATKTKLLHLTINGLNCQEDKIVKVLTDNGIIINDLNVKFVAEEKRTELFFTVKTPDKLDSFKLASQLSKIERLASFAINDK